MYLEEYKKLTTMKKDQIYDEFLLWNKHRKAGKTDFVATKYNWDYSRLENNFHFWITSNYPRYRDE